jgi:DNA-binding transcriptional LysR family regulator
MYPDIELDIRDFQRFTEDQLRGVDVMLVLGWPNAGDLIQRRIHAGRFIVVAAPSYWATHGMPQRPKDLERHSCLPIRGIEGTVMDLWTFVRDGQQEAALAHSWVTCSNPHRAIAIELALAGEGIVRIIDWMNLPEQRAGRLVRALTDWESSEAPPVNLLYRASVRRVPRVRAFLDFAMALFHDLDAARGEIVKATEKPQWLRRHYARSSAVR